MLFQFEVPDEIVELLELSSELSAEEIMEAHLYEWLFSKTHHEADLIATDRHKKIKPNQAQREMAQRVREIVYADAMEYSDEDLGIDKDAEKTAKAKRKLAVASGKPLPPFPNGQMGSIKKVIGSDKYAALVAGATEEEKKMFFSDKRPDHAGFLAKRIAEMEKSQAFKDYGKAMAEWAEGIEAVDNLARARRKARIEMVEAKRLRPGIRRVQE